MKLVGVEAEGMMACPCAQEMVRAHARERLAEEGIDAALAERGPGHRPGGHSQPAGPGPPPGGRRRPCEAEALVEIVEGAMSSENYDLLKRPDELHVVEKAHRRPRFVEDAVREMLGERPGTVPRRCPTTPTSTLAR